MKKKRGRSVRKNTNVTTEPDEFVSAPHSFVIHKGLPGGHVLELTKDFRKVMEPFTASALKERKKNTIKDFVQIAGPLHVSHMCIFSRTDLGVYLKLSRLPRGPTLTFKVNNFTLSRDVVSSLKKQLVVEEAFKHSPLIVLNSFSGEGMHMKLMASMFQNMFPTINLTNVDLNTVRRCVLMNYNPTTKLIDFRHFTIKVNPVGISKSVKKVVQGKVPNLAHCENISEFLTKSGMLSESEAEEDPNTHVTVSQKLISRGNVESGKSAIRLTELGPRLTLQLIKIEDGLLEGEVLYHDLVEKTEEEKIAIQKKRIAKKKLKEKRKRIQEDNTKQKEAKKGELKEKSLKGMKQVLETDKLMKQASRESKFDGEEDDDAQYYRDEVGEEPEQELFTAKPTGMKRSFNDKRPDFKNKRPRFEDGKPGKKFGDNKFGVDGKFKSRFKKDNDGFKKGNDGKFKKGNDGGFKKGNDGKFKKGNDGGFKKGNDKFKRGNNSGKFGNKKFGGKKQEKTNAKGRDFRPIGGSKGGVRKFGGKGGRRK